MLVLRSGASELLWDGGFSFLNVAWLVLADGCEEKPRPPGAEEGADEESNSQWGEEGAACGGLVVGGGRGGVTEQLLIGQSSVTSGEAELEPANQLLLLHIFRFLASDAFSLLSVSFCFLYFNPATTCHICVTMMLWWAGSPCCLGHASASVPFADVSSLFGIC